jgi:hypothetical protein
MTYNLDNVVGRLDSLHQRVVVDDARTLDDEGAFRLYDLLEPMPELEMDILTAIEQFAFNNQWEPDTIPGSEPWIDAAVWM